MIYNTSVVIYNTRPVCSYVLNEMHCIYRKIVILNNYILSCKVVTSHPLVILYLNCTFARIHLMCITTLFYYYNLKAKYTASIFNIIINVYM